MASAIEWTLDMSALRDLDRKDIVAAAEGALARALGTGFRIEDVESLSDAERRNLILRGSSVRDDGEKRSVIIKATRSADYDPWSETAFARSGLIREWAA